MLKNIKIILIFLTTPFLFLQNIVNTGSFFRDTQNISNNKIQESEKIEDWFENETNELIMDAWGNYLINHIELPQKFLNDSSEEVRKAFVGYTKVDMNRYYSYSKYLEENFKWLFSFTLNKERNYLESYNDFFAELFSSYINQILGNQITVYTKIVDDFLWKKLPEILNLISDGKGKEEIFEYTSIINEKDFFFAETKADKFYKNLYTRQKKERFWTLKTEEDLDIVELLTMKSGVSATKGHYSTLLDKLELISKEFEIQNIQSLLMHTPYFENDLIFNSYDKGVYKEFDKMDKLFEEKTKVSGTNYSGLMLKRNLHSLNNYWKSKVTNWNNDIAYSDEELKEHEKIVMQIMNLFYIVTGQEFYKLNPVHLLLSRDLSEINNDFGVLKTYDSEKNFSSITTFVTPSDSVPLKENSYIIYNSSNVDKRERNYFPYQVFYHYLSKAMFWWAGKENEGNWNSVNAQEFIKNEISSINEGYKMWNKDHFEQEVDYTELEAKGFGSLDEITVYLGVSSSINGNFFDMLKEFYEPIAEEISRQIELLYSNINGVELKFIEPTYDFYNENGGSVFNTKGILEKILKREPLKLWYKKKFNKEELKVEVNFVTPGGDENLKYITNGFATGDVLEYDENDQNLVLPYEKYFLNYQEAIDRTITVLLERSELEEYKDEVQLFVLKGYTDVETSNWSLEWLKEFWDKSFKSNSEIEFVVKLKLPNEEVAFKLKLMQRIRNISNPATPKPPITFEGSQGISGIWIFLLVFSIVLTAVFLIENIVLLSLSIKKKKNNNN
ncbi:hypothetical protein SCHIN_v1c10690 [Spiroplasma chinense]|uniref:Uncharacterized protein n=1 Tax=Spiroplasma chinense TaxID=216932 RepID=A0A5B9Y8B1_9MOLU|nr:hypothetical protein [Spiroplasma chinense]QEH62262.1 hypothetical protein SCHIN_v1c10690 [Spiroplasma chinense]